MWLRYSLEGLLPTGPTRLFLIVQQKVHPSCNKSILDYRIFSYKKIIFCQSFYAFFFDKEALLNKLASL